MHVIPQFMLLAPVSKASVTKSRFHAGSVAAGKNYVRIARGTRFQPEGDPRSMYAATPDAANSYLPRIADTIARGSRLGQRPASTACRKSATCWLNAPGSSRLMV